MKLKARKLAIQNFKEFIRDMMKEDALPEMEKMVKGPKKMMKVAVASDSPEGLKKGLSKAEEILKAKMSEEGEEDSEMSEMMEKMPKKKCMCEDPENCECEKEEEESEEEESYEDEE